MCVWCTHTRFRHLTQWFECRKKEEKLLSGSIEQQHVDTELRAAPVSHSIFLGYIFWSGFLYLCHVCCWAFTQSSSDSDIQGTRWWSLATSLCHSADLLHTKSCCWECLFSSAWTARHRGNFEGVCVLWWVLLCVQSLQVQACAAVFLLHCRGLLRLLLTTLDWFPWQPGCLHMASNQLSQMRAFVSTVTITKKEEGRGGTSSCYKFITYISWWVINCCLSNRAVKPACALLPEHKQWFFGSWKWDGHCTTCTVIYRRRSWFHLLICFVLFSFFLWSTVSHLICQDIHNWNLEAGGAWNLSLSHPAEN